MEITEIRVHLKDNAKSKLRAFVTLTFDNQFVIRDLKIIDGKKGLFVAMPSIKVMESCPSCGKKNPLRNRYCGNCGASLDHWKKLENNPELEEHRDIAHPINTQMRDYLQSKVMEAYNAEVVRAQGSDHQAPVASELD